MTRETPESSEEEGKRNLTGYHLEAAALQGQNAAAVALGAGDNATIRKAEGEIRVTPHEFPDTRQVLFIALQS